MAMSWGILNMSCDVVVVCQHLSGTECISYFSHSCHEMPDKCHLKKGGFILAHGLREQSTTSEEGWWQEHEAAHVSHITSSVKRQREIRDSTPLLFPFYLIWDKEWCCP